METTQAKASTVAIEFAQSEFYVEIKVSAKAVKADFLELLQVN